MLKMWPNFEYDIVRLPLVCVFVCSTESLSCCMFGSEESLVETFVLKLNDYLMEYVYLIG